MQRMKTNTLLTACLLVLSAELAAAQSGMASLRVRCDGDSAGAGVSINGQFKGECPFDAMVPEGTLKIEARKPVGKEYERSFVQEMRVGAGIIKSIEVVLGKEQLTAEAKRAREVQAEVERRAEAEREAQLRQEEAARRAEQQRQAVEAERQRAAKFERLRNAAEGGDVEAMAALADVLDAGQHGLPPDQAQALAWYQKAAEAGNAEAMFRLSIDITGGTDAPRWLRKAAQAGHRGAQERLEGLPRYCQASGIGAGFFKSTTVYSPGFEDFQADGTDAPIKTALEQYGHQLRRLQPGTWDKTLHEPTVSCKHFRHPHYGNAVICMSVPSNGVPFIDLTCGSGAGYRDYLRIAESEARKDNGSWAGGTMLFDWQRCCSQPKIDSLK